MRRSLLLVAVCVLLPTTAIAQTAETSFDLDLFRPSPHGHAFFSVESGSMPKSYALHVGLFFDYARRPFEVVRSGVARVNLIEHRLDAHVLMSMTFFDRLSIGVGLPIVLYQLGHFTDLTARGTPTSNTSLGDLILSPKVTLWRGWLDLALTLWITLPTGNENTFAGDRTLTIGGEVDASRYFGPVRLGLNFGYMWRQATLLTTTEIGHELYYRAGVGFDIQRLVQSVPLEVLLEIIGKIQLASSRQTPMEIVLGLSWRPVASLAISAGVGRGLLAGYGSPSIRGIFGIAWTPIEDYHLPAKDPASEPTATPATEPAAQTDADTKAEDETKVREEAEAKAREDAEAKAREEAEAKARAEAQAKAKAEAEERARAETAAKRAPETSIAVGEDGALPERVLFEKETARLLPTADAPLNAVAKLLRAHPEIKKLIVEGHTDTGGPDDYNLALSKRRAQAVVDFLVKAGILRARLEAVGKGETQPLVAEQSEADRDTNRRVVFKPVLAE